MNTREITEESRLTHWAQVMHDRADKGLSIRAYCEKIGIHENTYFYWQRKLRETAFSGIPEIEFKAKALTPKGWSALYISDEPAKSQDLTVEVGGCRITVCANTDSELLAKVCRTLKTL